MTEYTDKRDSISNYVLYLLVTDDWNTSWQYGTLGEYLVCEFPDNLWSSSLLPLDMVGATRRKFESFDRLLERQPRVRTWLLDKFYTQIFIPETDKVLPM